MSDEFNAATRLPRYRPIEKQILCLRFSLDGNKHLTWREIGERTGLSCERARQLAWRGFKRASGGLTPKDKSPSEISAVMNLLVEKELADLGMIGSDQ